MESIRLYIELGDAIEREVIINQVDFEGLIRSAASGTEVHHDVAPYIGEEGARSKDVATVFLASGVSIAAVILAISQLIRTLYRKPYLVEFFELEEIRNADGTVLSDVFGRPQMKLVKRHAFVEPRETITDNVFDVQWAPGGSVIMRISSSEKPGEASTGK